MTISAYPLIWPQQFPRAKSPEKGKFSTTLAGAIKNVQKSLELFASDSGKKLENLVISSNVTLGDSRPNDPGVAVWFGWDGLQVCIAVDRYTSIEGNLQAIHHIIEARRVELRHGTLALVRASFQGFKALPAPTGSEWWQVLGVKQTATYTEAQAAYRKLSSKYHPDRPTGNAVRMAEVNKAWEQAQEAVS